MIEYDFEIIPLTEEQQNAVAMGMVEMDSINEILKKIINKMALS